MGLRTESDICENILVVGDNPYFKDMEMFIRDTTEVKLRGWVWHLDEANDSGKMRRLFSDRIIKDDKYEVFIVNSSPYASVGEVYYVVFSPDRDSVKEFIKDFEDKLNSVSIVDIDSVSQTL